MYKNNFNQSNTGTNIEFFGCYDNNLSYIYFKENFERLKDDLYFCIDCGNVQTPQTVGDVFKIARNVRKSDLLNVAGWDSDTKQDIIDEILNSDLKDYEDFKQVLTLKPKYEIKETRGYSQGNFATVILNKEYSYSDNTLDHLFWDSPVYARFTINDQEYNYDEYDLDSYDWQRDEFLKAVSEASGVDVATLEKIALDQLDYE